MALGGCNLVFGLDPGSGGDDVAIDGPDRDDAPDDGTTCTGGDEDGDTIADGCDNCPHLLNPEQANGDGDGLGDACDPHGDSAQRIVRFDGFKEAPPDMTLFASAGAPAFVIEEGQLVDNDATPEIDQLARFPAGPGPLTLITRATVHNVVAPPVTASASIGAWGIIDGTGAFPGGVVAEAGMINNAGMLEAVTQVSDTAALVSARGPAPRPFGSGTTLTLVLAIGDGLHADFTSTDIGGVSDRAIIMNGNLRGTDVGLRTHSLGARFDYLLVFGPGS